MEPAREPSVVLVEAVGHLAYVATRRIYDEQPDLWDLGENGRARTLEDFGHHFRTLATLDIEVFAGHVRYCEDLWNQRGFPHRWLDDAWRVMTEVLADEMPPAVAAAALAVLRSCLPIT